MTNKKKFESIKKLLKFVYNNRYSDFYRNKYIKAGFNPFTDFNSLKDIKKIPLLSKSELLNADIYKLCFVNEKDLICIKSTSGTTGKPLYIFRSRLDLAEKKRIDIDYGRVLILTNPVNASSVFWSTQSWASWSASGDIHNLPATAAMANELKINSIFTSPTLAVILSDYLKDYPDLRKSLKYIHPLGELVSPAKRKFLEKLYPGVTILVSYGSNETGLMGAQCKNIIKMSDGMYFHLRTNSVHVEVIDPNTGDEVKPGEKGEIVVTNLYSFGTPMIRYRLGDLVSLINGKVCPCGFYEKSLLQVFGRANYDVVKAGGFELRREFLEKTIDGLKAFLDGNFEAHIYEEFIENKPKIRIELNLSLKKSVPESPILKQSIGRKLSENWQVSSKLRLKNAIESGLFEPIKINFVNFPVSMKTRKKLILHQAENARE